VVEGAARIRLWLPTTCPDAAMFKLLAGRFAAAGPWTKGDVPRRTRTLNLQPSTQPNADQRRHRRHGSASPPFKKIAPRR
jgi:hypothetical protein